VPDLEVAASVAGKIPDGRELKALVLESLNMTARKLQMRGFEVPRDVLIEHEPFSLENGLLSSVRKPLRPALIQRYGDRLEALYSELERKQREDLLALGRPDTDTTVLERVVAALEASLGLERVDPDRTQSFADLGGDSLGAASFALLLEEIFQVPVPVSAIASPAGSVATWAQMIESALEGGAQRPTVARVHGQDPVGLLRASDFDLTKFIDAKTLRAAEDLGTPTDAIHTVLLTGASGFLGRFLCLDWLDELSSSGGKVICIIRARDAAQASQRLEKAFGTADPTLLERFRALAPDHLEVLPGDLAEPNLGLTADEFARLATEVDLICHAAALVNHRLSYAQLFEPNVLGTAELIRLALTTRTKRFDFVSSTAVGYLMGDSTVAAEADDVRDKAPELRLNRDEYAAGYGASKWAGEVLLSAAHEQYGLPVNVYRSDMILAHRRFRGQLNLPDMFVRLLYSLVRTGIAPETFYERDAKGTKQATHYDALPVDFTAAAMVELTLALYYGYRTFHVVNYHNDDGVSLDTISDWVRSAGYPLERVAVHADWAKRFEQRLRALPEAERQQSSLNILGWLEKPHTPRVRHLAADDFKAAIARLRCGPVAPQLDEALIHKHLDDLRLLGLLPPAPPSPC
jgi:fatty acid CoA ligase FadD9